MHNVSVRDYDLFVMLLLNSVQLQVEPTRKTALQGVLYNTSQTKEVALLCVCVRARACVCASCSYIRVTVNPI